MRAHEDAPRQRTRDRLAAGRHAPALEPDLVATASSAAAAAAESRVAADLDGARGDPELGGERGAESEVRRGVDAEFVLEGSKDLWRGAGRALAVLDFVWHVREKGTAAALGASGTADEPMVTFLAVLMRSWHLVFISPLGAFHRGDRARKGVFAMRVTLKPGLRKQVQ